MSGITRQHKCQFCGKTFLRKAWFLRHMCKKKKQFEESNDIIVQQAFRVYSYWAKKTRIVSERKNVKLESFLKSPLKKSFVDLMMHIRENGVMSPYSYIDWIVENHIAQNLWMDEDLLDIYKEFLDQHENAEDHALHTLRHIDKWLLDDETRKPEEFFDRLTPGIILDLLKKGILKPWVIFAYDPVADQWLNDDTYNADVYHRIDDMVNVAYWSEKMDSEPEAKDTVKQVMDQLWEYQT